jgi:hypothetical protein
MAAVELAYEIQDRASRQLDEMAKKAGAVTEADKRLVTSLKAVEAALESRARALGVSTAQLKAMDAAVAKLAAEEKQMAEAAGRAAKEAEKLAAAQKKATDSAEKLANEKPAKALKNLGDSAGETESIMSGLAGALDLVVPGLGDVVRGAGDLAGGLEAVTKSGAGLAGILGTVVVVLGAAYLAYKSLTEAEERSAENARLVMEANQKLKPILEQTADALVNLREANGELSKEEAARIRVSLSGYRAFQQATEGTVQKMAELRMEQGSVSTQLTDFFTDGSVTPWGKAIEAAIDGVTTGSAEYEAQIAALAGTIETAAEATREFVDVSNELGGKEGTAAGIEEVTKALAERAGVLKTALTIAAQAGKVAKGLSSASPTALATAAGQVGADLPGLSGLLSKATASGDIQGIQEAVALIAEFEAAAAKALAVETKLAADVVKFRDTADKAFTGFAEDNLAAWLQTEAEIRAGLAELVSNLEGTQRSVQQAVYQTLVQGAAGFARFTAAAVQGNLGDALGGALSGAGDQLITAGLNRAMAGKVGGGALAGAGAALGVAAGGVGALIGLGGLNDSDPSKSVADALRENLMAQKDNLIEGIEALPEILLQVIPDLVGALVTELPPAIIRALAELLKGLVQKLIDALLPGDQSGGSTDYNLTSAGGAQAGSGGDVRIGTESVDNKKDLITSQLRAAGRSGRDANLQRLQDLLGSSPVAVGNPAMLLSLGLNRTADEAVSQNGLRARGTSLSRAVGGGGITINNHSVIGSEAEIARILRRAGSAYGPDRTTE